MAAPERATWHDDVIDVIMTSPRGQLCRRQQWALLTSALTKSTLTVDRSTGLVGSAGQWAPSVSLTSDAYRWDPCVRVKPEKEKVFRVVGPEVNQAAQQGLAWARELGRLG